VRKSAMVGTLIAIRGEPGVRTDGQPKSPPKSEAAPGTVQNAVGWFAFT
jgi:hypothetical protein